MVKGVMPQNIKLPPKYEAKKEQRNAWTAVNYFAVIYLTLGFPKWESEREHIELNSYQGEDK